MAGDRDSKGRFLQGNSVAAEGFAGLVEQRFGGDEEMAKEWLVKVGRYAYGANYRNRDGSYPGWVKGCFRGHPGTPEQFQRDNDPKNLEFTLGDVGETEF